MFLYSQDFNCNLVHGDAAGGDDKKVGTTDTARNCIDLVITMEPAANGITWVKDKKHCYAEFGATHIGNWIDTCSTPCKTCIFQGRLMRVHMVAPIIE